jgi:hypothetical protein
LRTIFLGNFRELFFERGELFFAEIFEHDQFVAGSFDGADEFVEFEMDRFGIAILHVLDEENHQEGDNRGAGIDDELPGVGEVKKRAGDGPKCDDEKGDGEGDRGAGEFGDADGKLPKFFVEGFGLRTFFLAVHLAGIYDSNPVEGIRGKAAFLRRGSTDKLGAALELGED